ncbi:hypothetical protein HFO25_35095, partial [Rhizobium laguerreae]
MTNLITPTTNVALTGDQNVDGLFAGAAWNGTITYAFPTTSASYAYSGEKDYDFSSISSQQQSFVLFFMEQSYGNTVNDGFSVEGFTNANFVAGSADTATVRFAQSSLPSTAWAYTPVVGGVGGDVWFGTEYAGTEYDLRFPEFGNYAGHAVAHELGHALGLKHAQEAYASNMTVVPSAYDSLEYTIMTYHTYVGDDLSGYKYEHDGAPQTYMMLDIAALQEMYGADYTTNSGNTVYKWNPNEGVTYVNGVAAITPDANKIFATVWDGGGIDTYDLSAYSTGLNINLQPGSYSVFSQGQLADLNGGPNSGYARGNIFNALLYHGNLASLIENVQAGSGNDTIVGNDANNTLWGNAGNDALAGGIGNDTLIGGAGLDTMSGGVGDDVYIVDNANDAVIENANGGTDTVQTALASYTIGTNVETLTYTGTGAFTGTGNATANTIIGGGGNDWLNGAAGADSLIGATGDDTYFVDNAADVVTENADEGTDTVRTSQLISYTLGVNVENLTYTGTGVFSGIGNGLDNTITGGAAADTLLGGDGNDWLNGAAGADSLLGDTGNDTYSVDNIADIVTENAGEGTDTVRTSQLAIYTLAANVENLTYTGLGDFNGTGNGLDNTIAGGVGKDRLTGGAGNDWLNGAPGADTLLGGTGNDTYSVDNIADVVTENASEGTDTVRTSQLTSYTLGANVENLTYTGTGAFSGIGNGLDNTITGGVGNDRLSGDTGNDTLIGGAGLDTMSGGVGDDVYVVDIATDAVIENANEGTDTVQTALASYTIGTNVETLTYTGTGAFTGTGNATANTIIGGDGNDWLNGAAGADTLIAGIGNDTYSVDNVADVVTENADEGTDTVRTSQLASYTLGANVENLTYTGTGAFSGIGNGLDNTITGGVAADTLSGGAGADWLNGAAGADSLLGGTGNDTYSVDNAGDVVTENANEGTDTVRTAALVSYMLAANVENLTYTGTGTFSGTGNALDNTITGGVGNDRLSGGAGNDWLIGAAGADTLLGGAGNDTYSVENAADVVTENPNEGTDTVRTTLLSYALAFGSNLENLTYVGGGGFTGTGNELANTITGGVGDDTLNGAAGADTLLGGTGNDTYSVDNIADVVTENADEGTDTVRATVSYTLGANVENLTYTGTGAFSGIGNGLDNTITGGVAADTLSGGAGADWLNGAAGADSLLGGTGNDTYSVDNAGDVVTENANEGTDTVRTAALVSYMLAANVENLTYTGTGTFSGTGNALDNTITGGVGNDRLSGGAGNDWLIGAAGADTLLGGAGNDTYSVENAADVVTENLNEGTDTVRTTLLSYALAFGSNLENLTYVGGGGFTGTGNELANTITGGVG